MNHQSYFELVNVTIILTELGFIRLQRQVTSESLLMFELVHTTILKSDFGFLSF